MTHFVIDEADTILAMDDTGPFGRILHGQDIRLRDGVIAEIGTDEMRVSATIGPDDTIDAAREIGMRFHPTRGAMSIGECDGDLPPDSLVERESDILNDAIRLIDTFHDPAPGSTCRVGVAPCSPFSVSRELMHDAAVLARDKGVRLHTHLAENDGGIATLDLPAALTAQNRPAGRLAAAL